MWGSWTNQQFGVNGRDRDPLNFHFMVNIRFHKFNGVYAAMSFKILNDGTRYPPVRRRMKPNISLKNKYVGIMDELEIWWKREGSGSFPFQFYGQY
jgi:hypothetical protein